MCSFVSITFFHNDLDRESGCLQFLFFLLIFDPIKLSIGSIDNKFSFMVNVAQLVRALVCGTKGRGFESRLSP